MYPAARTTEDALATLSAGAPTALGAAEALPAIPPTRTSTPIITETASPRRRVMRPPRFRVDPTTLDALFDGRRPGRVYGRNVARFDRNRLALAARVVAGRGATGRQPRSARVGGLQGLGARVSGRGSRVSG
ncbi:conserved hypothetical protein [Frankia alni ACN14a]|uniref:Uncharacterized protein n=1 Tax=Frankia alni (strain DSM 45986 / CECT 9034 / ACN14a) TaxID=326424 RepID=Q0RHV3_FRAAA|nr:conserved hypothetical protein [Frankia alni ACN14a]